MVKQKQRGRFYQVGPWQGRSWGDLKRRTSLESPADLIALVEQGLRGVGESLVTPDVDKIGGQT